MLVQGTCVPTIDVADQIGAAFDLTGWDMITPNLQQDLAKSGRLQRLVQNFMADPPETQTYIESVARRDAQDVDKAS